ncbi:MAG TPA: hypothetical protein VMU22_10245, partial [Rhizomicrobium sp.]|nr:hypothetical protein [Rhizomicrobium sp.]
MEQAETSIDVGETFRLKPFPIAVVVLAALGIAFLSFATIEFLKLAVHLPERPQMPWIAASYYRVVELLYAFAAIRILKRFYPGTFGLVLPEGKSFVGAAVLIGLLLGVVLTLVDYAPQIVAVKPPTDNPYPLTAFNIAGWLSYAGVFAAVAEEVLFRGLLVTYLVQAMPGEVNVRGFSVSGAGVVVAFVYAFSYTNRFLNESMALALLQVACAFVSGVV